MLECLPNFSKLSSDEKNELIVRLFAELQLLHKVVETLTNRVDFLETENKQLCDEVKDLRGKPAKNSQNSSKPPSSVERCMTTGKVTSLFRAIARCATPITCAS